MGKVGGHIAPPFRIWSHSRARQHAKGCRQKRCNKCWWAKKGPKWKAVFPWLRFGRRNDEKDGHFGFGCSICARFKAWQTAEALTSLQPRPIATPCRQTAGQRLQSDDTTDNFAKLTVGVHGGTTMKSFFLRRHQHSQRHQAAAQFLAGAVTEDSLALAPSSEDFAAVLASMQKGHSIRDGGACSDRDTLMHWCVSEALLDVWKKKLAKASTMCLVRDERKGKLLLRFRACGDGLEVCNGALGCIRMTGGSAEDIVRATARALKIFCTAYYRPPRLGKALAQCSVLDRELYKHLRSIVHILITDAHPAELLASNLMRGHRRTLLHVW